MVQKHANFERIRQGFALEAQNVPAYVSNRTIFVPPKSCWLICKVLSLQFPGRNYVQRYSIAIDTRQAIILMQFHIRDIFRIQFTYLIVYYNTKLIHERQFIEHDRSVQSGAMKF